VKESSNNTDLTSFFTALFAILVRDFAFASVTRDKHPQDLDQSFCCMSNENKLPICTYNNFLTATPKESTTATSTKTKSNKKAPTAPSSLSAKYPRTATETAMATVPEATWNNAQNSASGVNGSSSLLNFVTGSQNNSATANSNGNNAQLKQPPMSQNNMNNVVATQQTENDAWTRGGRQFASSREVYTRSLFRLCLKFTTSEDEDEGKPEPATAFWTIYGRPTTIGNGAPSSNSPDDICRRMDDSMTGPSAGILSRLTDFDGDQAAGYALKSGMTTGWHVRGDRGDAAVRVGKAKVFTGKNGPDGPTREAQILSLDAERWVLCKGASFAAGNSVFNVEDVNDLKQKITIHCSKGPMRGKLIDIHAARCPFIFGRAHEADLCIMDRELSRRHGAVLYLPARKGARGKGASSGTFALVDLESTVSLLKAKRPHPVLSLDASHLVCTSCSVQKPEWLLHAPRWPIWLQGHGIIDRRRRIYCR
jgi:hypothetical protein